ncbi:class I SAM-dependent methyltransferase [Catenulispora pinisilvae]|uniref:class I SAM-dependent methyltransferase n=1 Tax=Catenulispora pinisilvae TaxID=2705253 RepID=UPI001890F866|nr:class I SAM-dependent methyltransferase [Catenulispora pinisilvae]
MLDLTAAREHAAPRRELSALAIARYTAPGGLVVDLGCGEGRALVEAIRADRLAIGIERNSRLASQAREAVLGATCHGGPGFAAVVVGELADVPQLVGSDSLRRASLVLVDLSRVGVLGVHGRVEAAGIVERLADALHAARQLVREGGHVVVHAEIRHPFCRDLAEVLAEAGARSEFEVIEPDAGEAGQCQMSCALARNEEVVVLQAMRPDAEPQP